MIKPIAVYAGFRLGASYIINEDWRLLVQHTQAILRQLKVCFAYDPNLEGLNFG